MKNKLILFFVIFLISTSFVVASDVNNEEQPQDSTYNQYLEETKDSLYESSSRTFFAPFYFDKSSLYTFIGVLATSGFLLIVDKNYPVSFTPNSTNSDLATLQATVVFVGAGYAISSVLGYDRYRNVSTLAVISGLNAGALSLGAKYLVPQQQPLSDPSTPYSTYNRDSAGYSYYDSAFFPTGLSVACAASATYGYAYGDDQRWLGWVLGSLSVASYGIGVKRGEYWLSSAFLSCMSGVYIAKTTVNNTTLNVKNNKNNIKLSYFIPYTDGKNFAIQAGWTF